MSANARRFAGSHRWGIVLSSLFTRSAVAVALAVSVAACASTTPPEITNVSSVQTVPDTTGIAPIPATVTLTPARPEATIVNDLSTELKFQKAFDNVVIGGAGDLELVVDSTTDNSNDMGEAIGQGVVSGLTFGLASFAQNDDAWYSVKIDATLKRGDAVIATYATDARIETSIPTRASLADKQNLAVQRVNLAFKHALELLTAQIKQDREKILGAL